MSHDASSEWLSRIRDGDEAAYEACFRAHYEGLCRFACRFTQDMDEAEELVQGIFVKLWENRAQLPESGAASSYLFASVRNRALNRIEHLKVRAQHEAETLAQEKDAPASAVEEMEAEELSSMIEAAIAALPERCQEVFRLSRFQGMGYQEIADRLGISVKTVEVQMGKALKRLRQALRHWLVILLCIWMGGGA